MFLSWFWAGAVLCAAFFAFLTDTGGFRYENTTANTLIKSAKLIEYGAKPAEIAKYCYENDVPILGICAGQNNIARALGGTTYKISNPEKHDKSFDE